MKSKLVICTLALALSLNIVGCQNTRSKSTNAKNTQTENKAQKNNNLNEGAKVSEEEAMKEAQEDEFIPNQFSDETKESLNKLMPKICEKTKKLLTNNSHRIHEKFNMKEIQVLLISNMNRNAYLINSQNEKYGSKDEVIEYSTDTFKEKGILTMPYGLTKFNDRQTYAFNVDFFANAGGDEKTLEKELLKSIIHEAGHLILQKKLDENMITAEDSMLGSRAVSYPIDYEARVYRSQMLSFYKKALESEKEEDKVKNIKMANYFYKKYLDMNEENKNDTEFDKAEGQCRYFEYRGLALLDNLDKNEEVIKEETKKRFLHENNEINEDAAVEMGKGGEFYSIGSLAYANIYDLGIEKELNYNNPLKYLLNKYGYEKNEGDKELSLKVKEHYDKINNNLKITVKGIDDKINNEEYAQIQIPVLFKYEENGSVSYEDEQINYDFNGKSATIDKTSREIRIGSNRILLKSATVLSIDDGMMNYIYAIVPKAELQVENDKLTVQTKNIQIYDGKFVKENGVYKLIE